MIRIIGKIEEALSGLSIEGKLTQGNGVFDFGDFQIHIQDGKNAPYRFWKLKTELKGSVYYKIIYKPESNKKMHLYGCGILPDAMCGWLRSQ